MRVENIGRRRALALVVLAGALAAVPAAAATPDFAAADAFVWHPATRALQPVASVNRVDLGLLKGIDREMVIETVALHEKSGGRRGHYVRG